MIAKTEGFLQDCFFFTTQNPPLDDGFLRLPCHLPALGCHSGGERLDAGAQIGFMGFEKPRKRHVDEQTPRVPMTSMLPLMSNLAGVDSFGDCES